MLAAIEGMVTELRQIGVPVSLAERIDAMRSLRHLSLDDRHTVKAALRAVLVKTHDHELAFDTVFDLYFSPAVPQARQISPAEEDSPAAPPSERATRSCCEPSRACSWTGTPGSSQAGR